MSEQASIIISAVDKTEGALKAIQGNVGALEGQFGRLSNVVSGFAALAGVTAFAGVIKGAVDSAAGLHDMAQQTGATVESLSAMKGAAKIAGVEMEQVAGGLGKLSKNMLDASNGTGDALKVFNALGISVTDTSGRLKSSDAVMMEFSKALQTVGSSTERAAAAQLVFGKSGAALMPMLNDLSELSNLQAKVTTSQAAAADQLGDTMTKLEAVHKSWVTTVAMEVVPAANAFAEALLESATSANGLKTTSQELAADGSIKAWAIGAAQAGGYVIDVFDGAARSIKAIGLTIGAAAAQSSMIAQGNFGGAMAIGKEWLTDLDKLASKEQFSDILARKIADIGSESTKAAVGTKSLAGALATAGEAAATADKSLANLMDKLFGKDVGLDATYWKDLDTLFKGYKRGALDAESYATAVGKLTSSQKFNTAANAAAAKVQEDYVKNVEALINPIEQQAYQLERQVEFYGMTESAIQATLVARLEEARFLAAENGAWEQHLAFLDQEIVARKRIGAASSQKEFLDANKKAAEQSAKEWEKFSDDINRALTDALMRGFEDGKSFGQNFVDSLKNSLKTAALKIVVNVATSTGGSLVASAANAVLGTNFNTGSANGSGSSAVDYLNGASSANSLYNLANGSYIQTATNAWNNYAAGTTVGGYTLGSIGAGGTGVTGSVGAGSLAAPTGSGGLGLSTTGGTTGITGNVGGYGAAQGGTAGTTGVGGAAPTTPGTGVSGATVGAAVAVLAGWFMSSKAWQSGMRWDNTYGYDNLKQSGIHGLHHENQYNLAKTLFGEDFAKSEFWQTITFSALSQQLSKSIFGGSWMPTGSSALSGTFSDNANGFINGTTSQNFQKDGGWFSSDKEETRYTALNSEFQSMLDAMYQGTKSSLIIAAASLGDTTIVDKLKNYQGEIFKVSLANVDSALTIVSDALMFGMGSIALPSINQIKSNAAGKVTSLTDSRDFAQKIGDTKTVETLNAQITALTQLRDATWSTVFAKTLQEVGAVSRVFELLGKSIMTSFGTNNADNILLASDNIVQLFGSIDNLNTSFNAYYSNFYTQAEQTAQAWKDMGRAFDQIGVAMPTTRDGFRALVDGLDLTSLSGDTTFKSLMDLQDGFAKLVPAMTDVAAATAEIIDAAGRKSWGDKLAVLTGQKTQIQVDRDNTLESTSDAAVQAIMRLVFAQEDLATAAELTAAAVSAAADETKQIAEAMRVATISSFDRTRASNDAYKSSIQAFSTSGLAAITEAVSLEKQRIGVIRSVAAESVTSIKGVFSLLENQVNDLYGTVASTQAMQASEGSAFIASALQNALSSGYLPDQSALSSAISGARSGLDANNFATQFEADRAALVMAGQLSQLRAVAGQQLPAAEQAVKLADEQLKALDTSLTYYKKQLDSLNGIKEGTADLTGTVEEIGQSVIAKITAMNANFSSLSDALLNNIVTASKSGSISASDTTAELGKSGVAADKAALVGGSAVFTSSNGATLIDGVFRGTNGYQGSITDAKAIITEAFNGLSAKEFQSRAIGIGLSAAMIDYMYSFDAGWTNSWAKQNGLPAFAVGTNYVPQDMVAQIHEGEAIIPKAYNPALGNNNSRLEKLVEGLTAEVQRLQAIVDTGNKHASRTANAVNGNPEQPMLVETV